MRPLTRPVDPHGTELVGSAAPPGVSVAPCSGELRYRDLREINRGGMGVILVATDPAIEREVAIKVLDPGARPTPEVVRRFLREGQLTGQLEHPNIVPMHELGATSQGVPYFAMKLVRGRSLAEVLAGCRSGEGDWPLARLLRAFDKVCDAIGFAHARGVVHRDLKPANVMIGEFGEVLVMDWGLAKRRGTSDAFAERAAAEPDELAATRAGTIMGTPAYMSPEQADGRTEDIDERSDVYGLGAILYEILALSPPYEGPTAMAILARVAQGELEPPARRAPGRRIPAALDAIARRALSTDPARRYPSVAALQADLAAFGADRPVSALRESWRDRAARWLRRHPRLTLGVALAVLFGSAGLSGVAVLRARAHRIELLALAQQGRIAELVSALGGQLQIERDAALDAFLARWAEAERRGHPFERLRAELDPAVLERARRAFDRLVEAHQRYGVALSAEDYFHRALFAHLAGEHEAALADYDRAIAMNPERADALSNRGVLRQARGDLAGALADHDRAIALRPGYVAGYTNRGAVRQAQGDLAAALADFEQAVARGPGDPHALNNRGGARLALGQLDLARQDLDAALRAQPDLVEALKNRAGLHQRAGRPAEALADHTRVLDRLPNDLDARRARARLLRELGRLDEAATDVERVLRLDRDDPEAWFERGAIELDRGELERALVALDRALALRPDDPAALNSRGVAHCQLGRTAAGFADLGRAIALRPGYALAFYNRGFAHERLSQLDEALADYDRAIALDPAMANALVQRGSIQHRRHAWAAALADYDRAIALRPDHPEALNNRGILHLGEGRDEAALADFDRAIAAAPRSWRPWVGRAQVLAKAGRRADALAALARAVECCPAAMRPQLEQFRAQLGG